MFKTYIASILLLTLTGCVSMSKYEEKVAENGALKDNVVSLEEKLKQSEAAGKAVDSELQQYKEGITKLLEQHEQITTESMALATGTEPEKSALAAKKQTFTSDMEALGSRLTACEARIKELSAAVSSQKAVAVTPPAQVAGVDRMHRMDSLCESILNQEAQVAQLKAEIADLSRKLATSNEMESAAAAARSDLRPEIEKGEVIVTAHRDKLIVAMNEQILFESGSANITKSGKKILERMTRILKKVKNNQIRIEGHTDSALIGRKIVAKFPTNWDLAAARATAVVKHLQNKGKLDPKLLAMAGYGPYRPIAGNETEKGRKMNRRIEIALVPMEIERPAPNKVK